jgi:ABC-2 type transport system ATP-binding protein
MITIKNASRWYGEVIGVNDITCEIRPGVTALLGQNGAGKSTLMKLITGQLRPTTGEVEVFGHIPFANPKVYELLGFCSEFDNFPEHLTGRQFVVRMAEMQGMSRAAASERAQVLIDQVGMHERADKKLAGCSKGMRQRIKLAAAMVHDPKVIVLDEPLNGLDPIGRREFMQVLEKLANEGRAILVSSHILFEVEQMTRSILLMHRGRLMASGDLRTIRELIDRHPHRIRIMTDQPREAAGHLVKLDQVISAEMRPDGASVEIKTKQPDLLYSMIPGLSIEHGLKIYGVESPDNSLEAVFAYLVETP